METMRIAGLAGVLALSSWGCQSVEIEGSPSNDAGGQADAGADDGSDAGGAAQGGADDGAGAEDDGGAGADQGQAAAGGDDAGGDAAAGGDDAADAGGGDGSGDPTAPCGEAAIEDIVSVHAGEGCMNYAAMRADDEVMGTLACVIEHLDEADPASLGDSADQLAFWINSYNVVLIHWVQVHLADDPGWGPDSNDFKVFTDDRISIAGLDLALNDIEYQIILGRDEGTPAMKEFHEALFPDSAPADARVHAALNCGARSCPSLLDKPFVGSRLDELLQGRVSAWLGDQVKGAGPDGISQLFEWFQRDFDAYSGSVAEFIEAHRTAGLEGVDLNTIKPYDWTLNACP